MGQSRTASFGWSYWAIAIATMVWFGLGIVSFLWQIGIDGFASLPTNLRDLAANRPSWATLGFAASVFAGFAGGGLLIYGQRQASKLFALSLAGAVVHGMYVLPTGMPKLAGPEWIMAGIAPILVAAFLLWYAWRKLWDSVDD